MRAYVCGTLDTKGPELHYLADCLRRANLSVSVVDVSTAATGSSAQRAADVPAAEVAGYHPEGASAVLGVADRGGAIAAMSIALAHYIGTRTDLGGIIGAGGSGGTALLAPAMRALAVGVPKLLVSTVAAGNIAAYVGGSDLCMMPAVADLQGLNRISRRVLGNAAHALAGMMQNALPAAPAEKPALGLTMFGVTTPCVQQVSALLADRYDCIVFHATGSGGRSMEKLVESRLVAGVLDITTTEVADLLMGGVFPADETRFEAVIRTRIPCVLSCGALDMVNFGPMATVPERYRSRRLYVHNPQVTLMRTTPEENVLMAKWIAERVNRMEGKTRFLIPEGGVSAIDVPGQPFHDPAADRALFDTFATHIRVSDNRRLLRLPHAINDPAFAQALVGAFHEISP